MFHLPINKEKQDFLFYLQARLAKATEAWDAVKVHALTHTRPVAEGLKKSLASPAHTIDGVAFTLDAAKAPDPHTHTHTHVFDYEDHLSLTGTVLTTTLTVALKSSHSSSPYNAHNKPENLHDLMYEPANRAKSSSRRMRC
jgi:hypothetical protein